MLAPGVAAGLDGIRPGDAMIVLTWLDRAPARRAAGSIPRGDLGRPEQGVFNTRSPDRPNPIGLHVVEVVSNRGGARARAQPRGAGRASVLDVKPVLRRIEER